MNWELKTGCAKHTIQFGAELGKVLAEGELVALSGELGAGKTELVKGIASGLGCDLSVPVASPTYILLREYPGRLWLYHFDLYRIGSADELSGIGYEEYFFGDGVCAVEWADKFPLIVPKGALWIKLSVIGETERGLKIETDDPAKWQERLIRVITEDQRR